MKNEMRTWLAGLVMALAGLMAPSALATPKPDAPAIIILNFTADWCPNCQILNPRMETALEDYPGEVERVDLDFTATRSGDEMAAMQTYPIAIGQLEAVNAAYLWDYYAGITGVAVLVAADSGEPLSCFTRALSAADMRDQIAFDLVRVRQLPAGQRYREGDVPPHCP